MQARLREARCAYLRLSICHCGHYNTKCEQDDAEDFDTRVSLSPYVANDHCHNASTAPKDDMYWYRYVIAEGKIVGCIDGEEEDDTGNPYSQGYGARFEEERRVGAREVRRPCEERRYQELSKGD